MSNNGNKRIKVLEVIRQGLIGGGESHLLDLVYFMNKERYEPVCLSFTHGKMIERLESWGVKCFVIESEKAFDPHVIKQVMQVMKEEHVDLIHAHGSRAASNILIAGRRLHIPIIYTVHGWSFHDDHSKIVKFIRALSERVICRFAQRVICVSESDAETGRKVCGLKSPIVIENGINLKRFDPNGAHPDLRPEFGFSKDDFVVGFIARDTYLEAPLLFLEAICLVHLREPRVKALFVAEGELDNEADYFIERTHLKKVVYHSKFRHDIPAVLHCIDAYCLPSLWEGLPIALLEAMSMGKAVIATPTDGTKELLIDAHNGLLIPFKNPYALADAILLFMENTAFKKECEENARQLVSERFNAQRVVDSVQEVYKELIG